MAEAIFGLIGVVVGALITGAKDLWIGWYSRKKKQEYLAIRVATYMDYFCERCADVAGDSGEPDQHGCLHTTVAQPDFDLDSIEVDWKSISADLMYRILNFSNLLETAKNKIRDAGEYADPPDYEEGFEERQYQYAELGLEAYDIATVLRQTFKLPTRTYSDWSPQEFLEERKERVLRQREKRREQSRKMIENMEKINSEKEAHNNQINQGQG